MKLKSCFLAALVPAVILSVLFVSGFLSDIQLRLADNLYGGKPAFDSINIIAIDDESLQEIGRWPWNRTVFADVVDYLSEAKAIGIDVAFFEESDSLSDNMLSDAIKRSEDRGVPVVLPVEFTSFVYDKRSKNVVGKDFLKPIPALSHSKKGYINVITDDDGITRAVDLGLSEKFDHFAYVVFKEFWKKDIKHELPDKQRFLVDFIGPPGSFRRYSLADVFYKRVPRSSFRGKLVLIGATSPDLHDDYFVPTSKGKAMPGVEIHANLIQALINRNFLKQEHPVSVIAVIFFLSIILGLVFFVSKKIAGLLLPLLIIGYVFFCVIAFGYGVILNIVYPPLALAAVFISEILLSYLEEKKAKLQIRNAFSKYVSPAVLDDVMADPKKLRLGGVRKDITVFFSDIRGFTSISEKLSPEKLVHLLNEYLSAMTDIIMRHEGVVDKYIGDAIMAFWGAPLPQKDHAVLACSTSLDMLKKLNDLNKEWKKDRFPEIKIGIGLNSGPAVIGNMGSYERFDYTAMGDTINLGSRLESLTKQYGVRIIISESTKKLIDKAGAGFVTRKLDLVRVKGKQKPVVIFELVCREDELTEDKKEAIAVFEKGLDLYLKRSWALAINEFRKVDDFASLEFIRRCRAFMKHPPEKDWDGVWVMKNK